MGRASQPRREFGASWLYSGRHPATLTTPIVMTGGTGQIPLYPGTLHNAQPREVAGKD